MEPLNEQKINQALNEKLNKWEFKDDKIHRSFTFRDFKEAAGFLFRVAFIAEEQQHHPELFNVYNRVTISLNTHDAGGKVTEKDIRLAEAIEELHK